MQLLNTYDLEKLEEFMAMPIGMKKIGNFFGKDIYTSDKLKERFLVSSSVNGRTKPVSNSIRKLVDKEKLIPAFINKDIFSYFKYKWGDRANIHSAAAMYLFKEKKIIILMDNNISYGFANNDFISLLILHEGMHMAASLYPSAFISIFQNDLEDFYFDIFKNIFSLKGDSKPKEIKKIVKYLFNTEMSFNKKVDSKIFVNYFNILTSSLSKYTTLEKDVFNKNVRDWVVCGKLYYSNPMIVYNNARSFMHILNPIARAYKTVWGSAPEGNFFVQEILVPSEIISIRSEIKLDSNIYKAFKLIK